MAVCNPCQAVCIHPLMSPRARDELVSCAKHRLGVLLGWLPTQWSVCALSQTVFPWLVLGLSGEEMEVAGHPNRESLTSRTCCVWGNTVAHGHTPPRHRARPFHSLSCRPKQVHSTFRGASSVPSPCFFGWDICSSLSSSFGVLTACSADSLAQASLPSLAQGNPESFHCHRVPDSFQLHVFGFVEVRRDPLDCQSSIGFCSISGVFSWRTGMGRFSWALQDPARNHPPCVVWNHMGFPSCIPVFFYFCRYRFELVLLRVFVDDGSYWSTMVSDGLDLILHCWSAGSSYAQVSGRGLLLHESPTSPQALRWRISFYHQQHFLTWSSRTVEWFGLPRSRHPPEPLSS